MFSSSGFADPGRLVGMSVVGKHGPENEADAPDVGLLGKPPFINVSECVDVHAADLLWCQEAWCTL